MRCKREIWRVQLALAKFRKTARQLLTLGEKDPKRIFEGEALLRRLVQYGLLSEDEKKLDFVLQMSTQKILDRRLQTIVKKRGLARSIHEARCIIKQRHIRVGQTMVNVPSFMVRVESERNIMLSLTSAFGEGRPGRLARKKAAAAPADEE